MTHVGYLVAGWSIALGVLALYAWSIVRRGRSMSRHVAPERRRWMLADTDPTPPPGGPR